MLKKVLALFLAVVMCLSVFSACGGTKKKTNTSNAQAEVELGGNWDKPLFEEEVYFEIYKPVNDNYVIEGSFLDQLLKTNENLDVFFNDVNSFQEQFSLKAADRDIPEITWTNSDEQRKAYGPVGAFLDVNKYLDKMPNLKAAMEKYPAMKNVFVDKETGERWAISCVQEMNSDAYAFIYRKDVFDKLNMEWPTTQDGFYNALKTLKQNYPNSYPFVLRQMTGNMQGLIYWLPSWGTSRVMLGRYNLFAMKQDGTLEYPSVNQGMKECLTFLNKLYDEKLLHPNLLELTSNEWAQSFATETSFIGWDKMERIAIQLQPAGEAAGIEGFRLVGGAPIAFGSQGVVGTLESSGVGTYSFLLAKTLESDEIRLNQVLAFIDWLYSEEGIITTNYGGIGTTCERDAEGNFKFTEAILASDDPQYSRGLAVGGAYAIKLESAYSSWQDEYELESVNLANKYATLKWEPGFYSTYTEEEMAVWDTYATAMWTNTGNGMQSFIVGAGGYDIEKDWDSWVKKMTSNAYKYAQLKEIHENAYARYNASK